MTLSDALEQLYSITVGTEVVNAHNSNWVRTLLSFNSTRRLTNLCCCNVTVARKGVSC